jgi:hypothetical protein
VTFAGTRASNQNVGAWDEVFGDPVIATAILDASCIIRSRLNIKGESYRLREKTESGTAQAHRKFRRRGWPRFITWGGGEFRTILGGVNSTR